MDFIEFLKHFGADWKDFFSILGWVVSAVILTITARSYRNQANDRKAKDFMALRAAYTSNPRFQKILNELYAHPPSDFSKIKLAQRIEFMAFFEELAYLIHFGTIDEELALYYFGGDAIAAWSNSAFWGAQQNEPYWRGVAEFVGRMKEIEKTFFNRPSIVPQKRRIL